MKDKFKQLGGDTALQRQSLGWLSLKEALQVFQNVCDALNVQVIKKSVQVDYELSMKTAKSGKDFTFDEDEGNLTVYVDNIRLLPKVLPLLIKANRAFKVFCSPEHAKTISWKAIQTSTPNRSVDDLRNLWSQKIMPILDPTQKSKQVVLGQWTKEKDLDLLEQIV